MCLHLDIGECGHVIRVVVMTDIHQGVMVNNLPEDVRGSRALLGPQAVPLFEESDGVKNPAQDHAPARIQRAKEGGCLLEKAHPLWARWGVDIDKVQRQPLHMDLEVQQVARHDFGNPHHLSGLGGY
ncbi:unnamed protein product [Caretta caretta]